MRTCLRPRSRPRRKWKRSASVNAETATTVKTTSQQSGCSRVSLTRRSARLTDESTVQQRLDANEQREPNPPADSDVPFRLERRLCDKDDEIDEGEEDFEDAEDRAEE